jgi:hypothetical protein
MSLPVFCPECGGEYLPTATRCAECDVDLVSESALGSVTTVEELPPASELVCIRAAAVSWCLSLSNELSEAGIPHRIEMADSDDGEDAGRRPNASLPYGVYVRAEDAADAAAVDAAFMRSQIPDVPEDDASADAGCPACGEPVAPDAPECPECGLALA